MPEAGPTRPRIAFPAAPSASLRRAGDALVLRSVFPAAVHLAAAAAAALMIASGLLTALLAARTMHTPLALPRAWAGAGTPLLTAVALALALRGFLMARRIRPLELRIERNRLRLYVPAGVQLDGGPGPARRAPRGGATEIAWSAIERIQRSPGGLELHGRAGHRLRIPWRYPARTGLMGIKLGLSPADPHAHPAFRFDELDWLLGVIERFRGGDPGALADLEGWRPEGIPAGLPHPERPEFRLPALDADRLRVLVVVVASLLALVAGGAWGLLPER